MELYIRNLRVLIRLHQVEYYAGNPTVSDFEFDKLYQELLRLEERHPEHFNTNSPTQIVGH